MTSAAKYKAIGRFRRHAGRSSDVFLADGPEGQSWMIISNEYRDDPRSADIVLLERPADKGRERRRFGDVELGRRTLIEQEVAASLARIGQAAFWQPDPVLDGLPGNPDFWVSKPKPLIITVRGCGPHAHDCDHPEALAASADKRLFRTPFDAEVITAWAARGVPTIVIWGCAIAGPRPLDGADFDELLAQAVDLGEAAEISHAGLMASTTEDRSGRSLTS